MYQVVALLFMMNNAKLVLLKSWDNLAMTALVFVSEIKATWIISSKCLKKKALLSLKNFHDFNLYDKSSNTLIKSILFYT